MDIVLVFFFISIKINLDVRQNKMSFVLVNESQKRKSAYSDESQKITKTDSGSSSENDEPISYARLCSAPSDSIPFHSIEHSLHSHVQVPEFNVKYLQAYDDMKRKVYRSCHVAEWLKTSEDNDLLPVDLFWDLCGDAGTAIENCILEVLNKMKYDGIRFGKPLKEKNRSAQTATYDVSIFFDAPTNLSHFQKSCNIEGNCDVQNVLDFSGKNAGFTKGEIKSSKLKDNGKGKTCLDLKHIFLERFSLFIAAFRMKGMLRVFIMHKNIFENRPDLLTSNGVDGGLRLILSSSFSLHERDKAEKDILNQLTMLSFPWFNIHF